MIMWNSSTCCVHGNMHGRLVLYDSRISILMILMALRQAFVLPFSSMELNCRMVPRVTIHYGVVDCVSWCNKFQCVHIICYCEIYLQVLQQETMGE